MVICGDILHSRVARSNIMLLNTLGARVRVVAPSTLLPPGIERFGVEVTRDMREGLADADIVMMLRLQRERMNGSYVPSVSEYFNYWGLDAKKLTYAKSDALVMHPGPMNRGVEIDSIVADGAQSLIREQVEMGVAVRMAVLEALSRNLAECVRTLRSPQHSRVASPACGGDRRAISALTRVFDAPWRAERGVSNTTALAFFAQCSPPSPTLPHKGVGSRLCRAAHHAL